MAKNFVQRGRTLTVPVPAAGVTTGLCVLIGTIFGVALSTVAYAATAVCDIDVSGVWYLLKTSAQAWAVGDKIYWDATGAVCTNVPAAGLRFVGTATAVAANPSASGYVRLNGTAALFDDDAAPAPASYSTAGAVTLTAADLLGSIIVADTNGAGRTYTLPTAALLVAAIPGVAVGDIVRCLIVNGADAAEVLTLAAGSGGGFDANQTASSRVIGQNTSKTIAIRITNVTAASEAYVAYL